MGRIARLMPILAAVVIPSAAVANPPQVAFKQSSLDPAIVRLDQTGSGAVDLTHGKPIPSQFGAFSWAPDGSRLVYASRGIVGGDLYSVDGDGAGLTRLTANSTNEDPAWSRTGPGSRSSTPSACQPAAASTGSTKTSGSSAPTGAICTRSRTTRA